MTREQHRLRHVDLLKALDELVADWALAHPLELYKDHSILELIEWAGSQACRPTENCTHPMAHALADARWTQMPALVKP